MMESLSPKESPLSDNEQRDLEPGAVLRRLHEEERKWQQLRNQNRDVYVPPRAMRSLTSIADFDLMSQVMEFLDGDRKVFLLLGDSGSGKSTFFKKLETQLWEKYTANGQIPLHINLPEFDEPEHGLIEKHLRGLDFTEGNIEYLKTHGDFILICDGYDESQQTRNLYMCNRLNEPGGWRIKMLICCRTEYIGVDYKDCFRPINRNDIGILDLFQVAVIAPLNENQTRDFINQYASIAFSHWEAEEYQQTFKNTPGLQDILKNPFLLLLALDVLPSLLDKSTDSLEARITRIGLYDGFMAQWIARNKMRFGEMCLSQHDEEVFKNLSDSGFERHCIAYLKEFTTAVYDHQGGMPVIRYSPHGHDRNTWKETLFSNEKGRHLLREAMPLRRDGNRYRFIHKSILEYGFSLTIFDPNDPNTNTTPTPTPTPTMSRRSSTVSADSYEIPDPAEEITDAIEPSLMDSPLGRRYLVGEPSILQFLTERAQQHQTFKDRLLAVINLSKTEKKARIAAANAITILVKAGVHFNGADLQGIRIAGADLSDGVFDSAQLDGADLRKVNLRNTWLRQACLSGAMMGGVRFGESLFLKEESKVVCCAYSPDGRTLAVGLESGHINVYDTESWNRVHSLEGHTSGITCINFSSKGHQIASGSYDKTVRLWSMDTGDCIHNLQEHGSWVTSVAYSPKGGHLVTGSRDQSIRVWDVDTGRCIYNLQGHHDGVAIVVYSPEGDHIVSGSEDNTARQWDVKSGKCICTLQGHSGRITSIMYSPKGDHIVSGSLDTTVRLWDAAAGRCIHTLKGHQSYVTSVVYSPMGDQLASASGDKTVRLWDVDTGFCVSIFQGRDSAIESIVFSPKGNQLASGSYDGTLQLWDLDTGQCVYTFRGHSSYITSIVYSPEGDQIVSGSLDKTVRLLDADVGWTHARLGHTDAVTDVAFSPNGGMIVSGSRDTTLQLWDVETGDWVQTLKEHDGFVNSVVYLMKGHCIASGGSDKTVRLWDAASGDCIQTLHGHDGEINCVVCSPNGTCIASGSKDKTVRLWKVETGYRGRALVGHKDCVTGVAYSPNGDRIASGSWDRTVRLWDVGTGNCIRIFPHTDNVSCVAYSPRDGQIASGSWDKTVHLWNIDNGKYIRSLCGHESNISSIAYSPKGDLIASGSWDRAVKLWDVDTGHCLATISSLGGVVNSIAWRASYEGLFLVTGSQDRSVRYWRIINESGGYKVLLTWSSLHEGFNVSGASFDDVKGLNQLDKMLLGQHGVLIAT